MIVEYARFFSICSNGHLRIALVCGYCVIAALVLTEERRHNDSSFIESGPFGAVFIYTVKKVSKGLSFSKNRDREQLFLILAKIVLD